MPAKGTTKNKLKSETATGAVEAANQALKQAEARKDDNDQKAAAAASEQFDKAEDRVAADIKAREEGSNAIPQVPDPDPKIPLSPEEQEALGRARQIVAQVDDPNVPPLTKDAEKRLAEAEKLPPAPTAVSPATPGASATNLALMRNDVDPKRTPPFGQGARADLQG